MSENDNMFKIIALGDSKVGKTSIMRRFTHGIFYEENLPTIGLGFSFKKVTVKDGTKIKLKLIDTAGQEKFRSLAKSYYKNAEGVLFVFSYDDKNSFDHIEAWLNEFKENCDSSKEDIPMILVGNKCDLKSEVIDDNLIDDNLIEDLKKKIGINNFKKTSAKDNIGIDELFNELVEKMFINYKKSSGKKHKIEQLEDHKKTKKDKKKNQCCRADT